VTLERVENSGQIRQTCWEADIEYGDSRHELEIMLHHLPLAFRIAQREAMRVRENCDKSFSRRKTTHRDKRTDSGTTGGMDTPSQYADREER
jgi:hypothetical protein